MSEQIRLTLHDIQQPMMCPSLVASEGLDVAARDFLAGMSDRFAVSLYERLFIPKPWVGPMAWNQL